MTQQEAVKFLNEAKAVLNIAISAIKKQEPKKPILEESEIDGYIDIFCPNCRAYLTFDMKCCCYCGQALDWGEEK